MAGNERTADQQAADQLREYRRIVADAVGELRSQEIRDSFASISLEELLDQHIERMQESTDPIKPSRLQRLRKVKDDLVASVEAIKAVPPERFRRADPSQDVNTPVEND